MSRSSQKATLGGRAMAAATALATATWQLRGSGHAGGAFVQPLATRGGLAPDSSRAGAAAAVVAAAPAFEGASSAFPGLALGASALALSISVLRVTGRSRGARAGRKAVVVMLGGAAVRPLQPFPKAVYEAPTPLPTIAPPPRAALAPPAVQLQVAASAELDGLRFDSPTVAVAGAAQAGASPRAARRMGRATFVGGARQKASTRRPSAEPSAEKAERRATGSKIARAATPTVYAPASPLAFDASTLRREIQSGLRVSSSVRSVQARETKAPAATAASRMSSGVYNQKEYFWIDIEGDLFDQTS
mmetsp:Transcript_130617/g.418813  ORF Transcript_130617/g.418813 Transcript_130617/m.418813 type:complete len:304 (-) Transcript_130617:331-1242(-)